LKDDKVMIKSNSYNIKSLFKHWLIQLHYKYSQNKRSVILATHIAEIIKSDFNCTHKIHILDFGCGDMYVAKCIHEIIPSTNWTGTDVRENWDKKDLGFEYVKYENNKLPFSDNSFDIVLMNDVLHHIVDEEKALSVQECLRAGRALIIKDVFEKSFFKSIILILMDIIGNWAYNVKIPTHYFSKKSFFLFL